MGKILVGVFALGLRKYKLFVDTESNGGHVKLTLPNEDIGQIVVGINDNHWPDVQAILLHEAYEAVIVELGFRYSPNPRFSDESSNYVFLMTHNQLDEVHVRVSWFLDDCLKKFKKVYDDFWEKKNKEKKKKCT